MFFFPFHVFEIKSDITSCQTDIPHEHNKSSNILISSLNPWSISLHLKVLNIYIIQLQDYTNKQKKNKKWCSQYAYHCRIGIKTTWWHLWSMHIFLSSKIIRKKWVEGGISKLTISNQNDWFDKIIYQLESVSIVWLAAGRLKVSVWKTHPWKCSHTLNSTSCTVRQYIK